MIRYFAYLLVIFVVSVTCTDISIEDSSDNAFQVLKGENRSEAFLTEEICNDANPCQNGGTCYGSWCRCWKDYTGSWCETPTWCTAGRCGYGNDVQCVWNRLLQKGECRCKEDNYYYLPTVRKCQECGCGDHGKCLVVDDMPVCKCEENYAVKSSKCEYCYCGLGSTKCSFNSVGGKVCQCREDHAPKSASWSSDETSCEMCDCGDHGRCYWRNNDKICDCDDGFRVFKGKCKDCQCGASGTCKFDLFGEKVCSCDYGFADWDGICLECHCSLFSRRYNGVNCIFDNGIKKCICPPGFKDMSDYCEDIDECYTTHPCPANTRCINKPGTFECRCNEGFEPIDPSSDLKFTGCKDIDECLDFPCKSPVTECVNSPGSYDCVCNNGYYGTSGTYGHTYKPAYNTCLEIETQWREATIALGVIFSVILIGITSYIKKHRGSS